MPSASESKRDSFADLEKTVPQADSSAYSYTVDFALRRKLWTIVVLEATASAAIYYHFSALKELNEFLASALLGAANAMLAQSIHQAFKSKFSPSRVLLFLAWGAFNGYATVVWIEFLLLKFETPLHRILVDQVFGTPFFQLAFNVLSSVWDYNEITFSLRNYLRTLRYSYCFWPFFAIALFYYIPVHLMLPANCLASLAWNVCLSLIS